MIPQLRERFNHEFTQERYAKFLQALEQAAGTPVEFRVCETPVFTPSWLMAELETVSLDLIAQITTPEYLRESQRAVPEQFRVPHDDDHPIFVTVDFAVTQDQAGRFTPKLIELQGFPSLYGYQLVLQQTYRRAYGLEDLICLPGNLTEGDYLASFKRAVLGNHAAENVILMEITPEKQKTYPDFLCTERFTGVKPVCITAIKKRGRKLYYQKNDREIPIYRIYNRVIVDEFVKRDIQCEFNFRAEVEVEWAGHPNWYFRLSKFSIPYLDHPAVPEAQFLDRIGSFPARLSDYVLKPLFSFAGRGVNVEITPADLDAIPETERKNYILQEKIEYAPAIKTPDEPSKVEVRMMFIWDRDLRLVNSLARLSKGKMMGVDFNKNKDWVGSSACFFETH